MRARVESLKTYYETQSSGRYSVDGLVTDWVKVHYNEARYGRSNGFPCAQRVQQHVVPDPGRHQRVGRRSVRPRQDRQQIAADLRLRRLGPLRLRRRRQLQRARRLHRPLPDRPRRRRPVRRRPIQGEDAIWAHRWKGLPRAHGPQARRSNPQGGTQIDSPGLWVARLHDPARERRPVGVRARVRPRPRPTGPLRHRRRRRRQRGRLVDASWRRAGCPREGDQGIGTRAADLGPWEKLRLGWLDYEIVLAGDRTWSWGRTSTTAPRPQGVVVPCCRRRRSSPTSARRTTGENQYWSSGDDDYEATLSRQVTLPARPRTLSFQARWNIEDCGAGPVRLRLRRGRRRATGWTAIPGSITKPAEGNGIDGTERWVPATFDLSAYAGQTIGLRLRYITDGAVRATPRRPAGLFVDDIKVDAAARSCSRTARRPAAKAGRWTGSASSAQRARASTTTTTSRRTGSTSRTTSTCGPGRTTSVPRPRPDWVEHFPYQDGLLIWYWDTSHSDNDEAFTPVRARSCRSTLTRGRSTAWTGCSGADGSALYDATFGLQRADSFTLHVNSEPSYIRGQDAVPVFDDRRSYWDERTPTTGVKVPNAGVRIRVLEEMGRRCGSGSRQRWTLAKSAPSSGLGGCPPSPFGCSGTVRNRYRRSRVEPL